MKRDLAGVRGKYRMRTRDGDLETFGEDGNEKGLVMKKKGTQQSKTGIGASLTRTTEIQRRATTFG